MAHPQERRAHVEHVEGQLAAARAAAEELAAQSEALDARASEVAANHAAEFAVWHGLAGWLRGS
jgi:hypothetical protein